MTPIQWAILRAGQQTDSALVKEMAADVTAKLRTNRSQASMSSAAQVVKQSKTDFAPVRRQQQTQPKPDPNGLSDYLRRYAPPPQAEQLRMAAIEGQREAELIAHAEAEARRRRIARCDAEIAALEARPADVQERAYLVTMGIEDLRAEIRYIETGSMKAQPR